MTWLSRVLTRTGKRALLEEEAAPELIGFRSIIAEHPARTLTPARLAVLLREAEQGNPRLYLELADDLEEQWAHYRSVIGTRRTQISQLDVTVQAASDGQAAMAAADLVRTQIVQQPWFTDLLFDLLDGISKGYSVCEVVWELSASQWQPVRVPWRDPRWFRPDIVDGTTLRLDDGSPLGSDLTPYKYIIHRPRTKSGLPIRGGLARPAGWLFLVANSGLHDWAEFVRLCGFPFRIGKYGPGASDADKRVLMRAVRGIARDAAAIIPASMTLEFERVRGEGGKGGDIWERLITYADQQASKLVLGQTATTDAIAGGHAVGREHNDVRGDIERSDARQLAATITRDLIIPFCQFNCGKGLGSGAGVAYPTLTIGRPEAVDIAGMAGALGQLVPLGLTVDASEVRRKIGFSDPKPDAEVLAPRPGTPPPSISPPEEGDDGGEPATATARTRPQALAHASGASIGTKGIGTKDDPDAITDAIDTLLGGDGWQAISAPLVDPMWALSDECRTLEELRDRLPLLAKSPDPALIETLARLLASARLAGLGGAALEPDGAPEPGRVRRG